MLQFSPVCEPQPHLLNWFSSLYRENSIHSAVIHNVRRAMTVCLTASYKRTVPVIVYWILELIWLAYLSPNPHFWQPTRALLYGLAVSILATQPTTAKLFIHLLTAACLSLLQSVWRLLVVKGPVTVSEANGPRSNNNSQGPKRDEVEEGQSVKKCQQWN